MSTHSSSSIKTMTGAEAAAFFARHAENDKPKRKELAQFLNRVCGNPARLEELAYIGMKDHGTTEFGQQCGLAPCDPDHLREIQNITFAHLLGGKMKVSDGKTKVKGEGQWKCGDMGSRWFDFNHGGADVRVSFLSRKFSEGEWKVEQDYAILINVERTA